MTQVLNGQNISASTYLFVSYSAHNENRRQVFPACGFCIFAFFRGKVALSKGAVDIQNAAGGVLEPGGFCQTLGPGLSNAEQVGRHGKETAD